MRPPRNTRTVATWPLLTEAGAKTLLTPLTSAFVDGHLRAWGQWQRLGKICETAGARELIDALTQTTRANIVNNHCVLEVVEALGPYLDAEQVRTYSGFGFTTVIVVGDEGSALVRFKLLDGDLRTRNVTTEQQRALDRQVWDEGLLAELGFDTRPPTVVTCGYQLNSTQDEIKAVSVVCWQKKALVWSYTIHGEGGSIVADFPFPGMPPRVARVVSKRAVAAPESAQEASS